MRALERFAPSARTTHVIGHGGQLAAKWAINDATKYAHQWLRGDISKAAVKNA